MTASQARKLNGLRINHDIDVCYFRSGPPALLRYKFYVMRGHEVLWNPVDRDGEGVVTGYQLLSFEEGLKEALLQAAKSVAVN